MGEFVKGDVVVVYFPFSDFSTGKRRPALVIKDLIGDDVIMCSITTQTRQDGYSVPLHNSDFAAGRIDHNSYIRPNHLFTGESKRIVYRVGTIAPAKVDEVVNKIIEIIRS